MATGFNFGSKTTTTASPFGTGGITFGTPASQSQPTFNFGGGTTGTPQQGLGALPASNSGTLGLFGSTQTTPQLGGFGATAAQPTQPAGGLFGTTGQGSGGTSGITFGAPATTSTLSFGPPAATSTTLTFGTSSANNSTTGLFGSLPTTAPTLSFGTTTTSQPLGALAPTSNTGSLNFGFGTSTTPQLLTLPTTTTTTTTVAAPSIVGLGGEVNTQAKQTAAPKEVSPKDQPLPNEILQTVEQFKEFVKQEKVDSSEITRCSVRDFRNVEEDIDNLTKVLNQVEGQLQKNRHLAENLKYNTAKCFQDVEMCQRTQEIPPSLQYENTAPLKFFTDLADRFEKEMQTLKTQIESVDKQIKDQKSSNMIGPQDLNLGLKRLHDTFVFLAGRLYSVHNQVEAQKESYLTMRRKIFNDHSNPFETINKSQESIMKIGSTVYSPPKVAVGPTPFSNLVLSNGNVQNQSRSAEQTATTQTGFTATSAPQNYSFFGSTNFNQSAFNTSSNFQLQKPPTGNKRGKQ